MERTCDLKTETSGKLVFSCFLGIYYSLCSCLTLQVSYKAQVHIFKAQDKERNSVKCANCKNIFIHQRDLGGS